MKKILIIKFLLLFFVVSAQSWEIEYSFKVKNELVNRVFEFPAHLYIDQKGQKLYKVKFGISEEVGKETAKESFVFIAKGHYDYLLYKNPKNTYTISDKINGKEYIFEDKILPQDLKLTNESKQFGSVTLNKAEMFFRGRNYHIWYDSSAKIKAGPWKFENIPGLVYQIYDDNELFVWELTNLEKLDLNIKNPFNNPDNSILSYEEYPKIKYALSEKLKMDLEKRGSKITEQRRDGLELVFEWEK